MKLTRIGTILTTLMLMLWLAGCATSYDAYPGQVTAVDHHDISTDVQNMVKKQPADYKCRGDACREVVPTTAQKMTAAATAPAVKATSKTNTTSSAATTARSNKAHMPAIPSIPMDSNG